MKENELRIGNWVNQVVYDYEPCNHKPIKFHESLWYRFSESIEDLSWYEPILLTEKWLIDFGFEKEEDTNEFTISGSTLTILKLRLGVDLRERYEMLSRYFNPDLDYVHQLQNLYFALTGKELELK